MIKIIAGDPGKGSIALSGGYRVAEGDQIQLFHEDLYAPKTAASEENPKYGSVRMTFTTLEADSSESYEDSSSVANTSHTSEQLFENAFRGGSCSGILLGGPSRTWRLESVGSTAILE